MKAGQTNLEVGQRVKITGFTGNDALYNGLIGEVTHPFASGCTDPGWIGLRLKTYTVYGYTLNCKETEVKAVKERVKA
jgi:hypothetical protein